MIKLAWDTQRTKDRADGKYVREESHDLYHTTRWTKLSRVWRQQHPLCEECKRQGRITAGQVVDHIVPFPVCKDYFYDESNLQTLCEKCNHDKGQRDKATIKQWRKEQGRGA